MSPYFERAEYESAFSWCDIALSESDKDYVIASIEKTMGDLVYQDYERLRILNWASPNEQLVKYLLEWAGCGGHRSWWIIDLPAPPRKLMIGVN
jgi:hypothetical protein